MNELNIKFLYLLQCAINLTKPDIEMIKDVNIDKLYCLANQHSVRALIHFALEQSGIHNESFYQAYMKAIRKSVLFDTERTCILHDFNRCGIWYMPLKGAILKELYPESFMREMSDNDILYDVNKQNHVKEIMLKRGYAAESIGILCEDVYKKPPVLNFEMHTKLFGELHDRRLYEYYREPISLMKKDPDKGFGYHLNDEDFYVYMTAHEWKHYSNSGTGIRSLLDCYVFCRAKGDNLNWNYIRKQTEKLGISAFEHERRELAMKVFSSENNYTLTEKQNEMLMRYLSSGTYGKLENKLKKDIEGITKKKYILKNMFPSLTYMKYSVDFVRKFPYLYPLGIVYRWGRVLLIRRNYLKQMMNAVKKYGK